MAKESTFDAFGRRFETVQRISLEDQMRDLTDGFCNTHPLESRPNWSMSGIKVKVPEGEHTVAQLMGMIRERSIEVLFPAYLEDQIESFLDTVTEWSKERGGYFVDRDVDDSE